MVYQLLKFWNDIPQEFKEMIDKLSSKYSRFMKQETLALLSAFQDVSTDFLSANKIFREGQINAALEKLSAVESGAEKAKFIAMQQEAKITKLEFQKGGK